MQNVIETSKGLRYAKRSGIPPLNLLIQQDLKNTRHGFMWKSLQRQYELLGAERDYQPDLAQMKSTSRRIELQQPSTHANSPLSFKASNKKKNFSTKSLNKGASGFFLLKHGMTFNFLI